MSESKAYHYFGYEKCTGMRRNISSEISILEKKVAKRNKEIAEQQRILAADKITLENLRKEFASEGITVSDHALRRYMERVLGFNLELIINEIISEELKKQVGFVGGSGKFPIANNHTVVMKDYNIITII